MKASAIWVLLLGTLVVGCVAGSDSQDGFVVVDSAGVTIALNSPEAVAGVDEWTVALEPTVEIGVVEGEGPYQFSSISGVSQLSDGTIVALDAGARELRYFDATGKYLHATGRSGEGPGEFSSPRGPWVLDGDTLAVWDPSLGRLTLFDQNGAFVAGIHTGTPFLFAVGFTSRRNLIIRGATATANPGDPEEIKTNQQVFQLVDLEAGSPPDTIDALGQLQLLVWSNGQAVGLAEVPFTVDATGATGVGRLVVTEAVHREVRVYGEEGDLELLIRVGSDPDPVLSQVFQDEVERRVSLASPESREVLRQRYASMPVPETEPTFTKLFVDDDGNIWAQHFQLQAGAQASEPSRWTVFSGEGRVIAKVLLPAGFTPYRVSRDGVLGVHRDPLGVEFIRLLPIER